MGIIKGVHLLDLNPRIVKALSKLNQIPHLHPQIRTFGGFESRISAVELHPTMPRDLLADKEGLVRSIQQLTGGKILSNSAPFVITLIEEDRTDNKALGSLGLSQAGAPGSQDL
jgi:hypothetical protein